MAKILVVDDSSFQRRLIKNLLGEMGHEVVEAENGAVGLQAADDNDDLDAILLDLLMPEMDGFETLERFQLTDCRIPRIVVTADVQQRSVDRCMKLGAVDVLAKPPDKERLQAAIAFHAGAGKASK